MSSNAINYGYETIISPLVINLVTRFWSLCWTCNKPCNVTGLVKAVLSTLLLFCYLISFWILLFISSSLPRSHLTLLYRTQHTIIPTGIPSILSWNLTYLNWDKCILSNWHSIYWREAVRKRSPSPSISLILDPAIRYPETPSFLEPHSAPTIVLIPLPFLDDCSWWPTPQNFPLNLGPLPESSWLKLVGEIILNS